MTTAVRDGAQWQAMPGGLARVAERPPVIGRIHHHLGVFRRSPDPLRVGLFATVFVQLWPVQSTTAFTSMPMGGWFFLLLGWALAETRVASPPP